MRRKNVTMKTLKDGRVRLRWSEWRPVNGEMKRTQPKLTLSREAGILKRAEILRQLEMKGYYDPPKAPEDIVCNLEQAALAYMQFRKANGAPKAQCAPKRLQTVVRCRSRDPRSGQDRHRHR
jgi:hypothetical protein